MLAAHLPGLLAAAIGNPSARLPDILAAALTRCPQPEAAVSLTRQLPGHSIGLAALAATLSSQAVAMYRQLAQTEPDAYLPDLARALVDHSHWLTDLGWLEEALTVIEEAVTIYQQLASAEPNFVPILAMALLDQSNTLWGVLRN